MIIPLTSGDLRDIARTIDETARRFGESEEFGRGGITKYGTRFGQIKLDVLRPGDDREVIGYITYKDGWLGFVPKGADQ